MAVRGFVLGAAAELELPDEIESLCLTEVRRQRAVKHIANGPHQLHLIG